MTEKERKMRQPVRITLAMALWALILWFLTLGHPGLQPVAKAILIIFVLPMGLVEWLKYKGAVSDTRAGVAKVLAMVGAALLWYFSYR
ncbi:hypothetical protein [Desulfoscipio geothermicus]|uniref:Uncharacterized protein n=1 Tax=Desulfoscipio geothermicus DSM 3669 TaxID=1121426 RepID=A0A1I6CRP8_9FIRM|nr:hypothetical protein [Desulfoscipio geothermicus]SFQ95767.1 hypothetical protein SAMN05660706_101247 [Desulfoscipio geothermicus DSM 3669]